MYSLRPARITTHLADSNTCTPAHPHRISIDKTLSMALPVVVWATLALAIGAPAAQAEELPSTPGPDPGASIVDQATLLTASDILEAVGDAGFTQGAVQGVRTDADSALVTPGVDVPRDGDDLIRTGPILVSVPDAAGNTAQRLDPDTVAYRDDDSATVIQPTSTNGTQIIRVSNDPESMREFVVDLESKGDLTINATGGVDITRDGQLVGQIRPPKAMLDGQSLPTRFVIDGTLVKQLTTVPDGATGTVVLDHWFGNYIGCITGIGVPIGAAIVIVAWAGPSTIYLWATRGSVTYRAGGPPIMSTYIKRYGRAVYGSCRRYLKS